MGGRRQGIQDGVWETGNGRYKEIQVGIGQKSSSIQGVVQYGRVSIFNGCLSHTVHTKVAGDRQGCKEGIGQLYIRDRQKTDTRGRKRESQGIDRGSKEEYRSLQRIRPQQECRIKVPASRAVSKTLNVCISLYDTTCGLHPTRQIPVIEQALV